MGNFFLKTGRRLNKIYSAIGIFAMALMTACVIFAVIARYCFNISFRQMEEFISFVFAFTTFWGIGICILSNDHVKIDSIVNALPRPFRRIVKFFDFAVIILVLVVMIWYGADYTRKYGHQISFGMRIPYFWMYGLIPLCCFIGLICIFIKIGSYIQMIRDNKD
jgi:TRAP-type C4-dicarboxylate transport system permease small subunit